MVNFFNLIKNGKFIKVNKKYNLNEHNMIKHPQNIITNKNNNVFYEKDIDVYLKTNNFIQNKKLISISPGGIKGFYLMGVLNYIKQNYDLSEYIFSGASAGAWNSLFMCFNKNPNDFVFKMLTSDLKKTKSINELEYLIKYKILKSFSEDDFNLERLFIGVTTIQNNHFQTSIFSDFDNLEDAINCCIASSHIPLITGGLSNRYHDMYTFDGGFSTYPYLNLTKSVLHVNPNMWEEHNMLQNNISKNNKFKKKLKSFFAFKDFLFINKNVNFIELYDNGYADAKKNKKMLDDVFLPEQK
jgi:predicted patatin/cPLA2 family phospholipase